MIKNQFSRFSLVRSIWPWALSDKLWDTLYICTIHICMLFCTLLDLLLQYQGKNEIHMHLWLLIFRYLAYFLFFLHAHLMTLLSIARSTVFKANFNYTKFILQIKFLASWGYCANICNHWLKYTHTHTHTRTHARTYTCTLIRNYTNLV